MTSFIIKAHTTRALPPAWAPSAPSSASASHADTCPFCRIITHAAPAVRVYEDARTVGILDILPLRPGHTLLIPKTHVPRLSDLPAEHAAALGAAVARIARALVDATGNTGLNVVCNQEYAQAVAHVHYHVIPAPLDDAAKARLALERDRETSNDEKEMGEKEGKKEKGEKGGPLSRAAMHRAEFESRAELDEEAGEALAARIRAKM